MRFACLLVCAVDVLEVCAFFVFVKKFVAYLYCIKSVNRVKLDDLQISYVPADLEQQDFYGMYTRDRQASLNIQAVMQCGVVQ